MGKGNVFTIPPGAPFLKVLARSLADGVLIDGFGYQADDPLSLASATIYVPTRRAARLLRSEFVDLAGGRAAILPTIRPLGETDDDAGYFDEVGEAGLDQLPPINPLARLVELARLILLWRNTLPQRLRDIHENSPLEAPASPADALWLARNLTELIDAIETEETGWERLENLNVDDRATWWQLTAEFLQIARTYWPSRLAELNRTSPALHRNWALRAEAARIVTQGTQGPVVVAGSTGSIPATAELIAAIHGLTQGAVVLPGLDCRMSEPDWLMAGAALIDGGKNVDPASRSHPQYGLFHLMHRLGTHRDEVRSLAIEPADIADRTEAVSVAFTPAEAAINHRAWRDGKAKGSLDTAFADVALIEASNEREEALTIAIALKLGLDGEGGDDRRQVALVTPDRTLARRVSAELLRFGIEADDSAGKPLVSSHHGSLVHLALEAILRPGDPVALASLLKHPLVQLGRERARLVETADALELLCLRGGTTLADPAALQPLVKTAIAELMASSHRKQWQARLFTPECQSEILQLAADIETAVEPLARMLVREQGRGLRPQFALGDWAEATGLVLERLCVNAQGSLESLWSGEAGEALAALLKDLIDTGSVLEADGPQWIDVITALLAGIGIKPATTGHPRVFIWGTLEARLLDVDTLILGGMNEGIWPGTTANNPFLSRAMKTEIGLEPPERRIGQAAHDFVMALGSRRLIMTRALRQGGAPSVASRFVQRLKSITGEEVVEAMLTRGAYYLRLAGQIDEGEDQAFASRPEPRPDARLQPKRYSFSEAGKLRRDPYAIYAHRVLKLDPVEPFNEDPGAAERGTLYHAIVEQYVRQKIDPRSEGAFAAMAVITAEIFDKAGLSAHIDAVWRPRFLDTARSFLAYEAERKSTISQSLVEVNARLDIAGADLAVTGRADRIDLRKDKKADIIDYKTGASPSMKEARALLDPQLSLEAAVLKAGGFKDVPAMETQDLLYIRLRAGQNFKVEAVNNEGSSRTKPEDVKTADDLGNSALSQLIKLTAALREKKAGFKSRVAPFKDRDYGGEYDHLARVSEWSSADSESEGEDE